MAASLPTATLFPQTHFFLIAGPCVIEDAAQLSTVARVLKDLEQRHALPVIFKASFDKANRSSLSSYRGPGLSEGLKMLKAVRTEFQLPILSDVHTPAMIPEAAATLDVLQIPAFLARQTDLYIAAAQTGRPLHIKKAQFMAAHELGNAVEKFRASGGTAAVAVCERGSFFGYGDLVVDFRTIAQLKALGLSYVYDASHSIQKPAAQGTHSGGTREYLRLLAHAQVAAGAHGIFIEAHPQPARARSDAASQYPLDLLPQLISELLAFYQLQQSLPATIQPPTATAAPQK